jgi:hypothetical protein
LQSTPERELLPMAESFGLGVMGWSPMAAGILTGKYQKSERGRATEFKASVQHADNPNNDAVIETVSGGRGGRREAWSGCCGLGQEQGRIADRGLQQMGAVAVSPRGFGGFFE